MRLDGVEHWDHFQDETIYWLDLSDMPEPIQQAARRIDGKAYNDRCFGICVVHDLATNEYAVVTESGTSPEVDRNIFYVDNDGDKHWFQADLPDTLVKEMFSCCEDVHAGKLLPQGYQALSSVLFDNETGFVSGENQAAKSPFSTWQLRIDHGHPEYYTPHYYKKNIAAELETALSIITTAYLRNEDIQTAVEENLEYLNPPVKSVFAEFLARIQLVDPDVDAALQDMGTKIDNAVFREWVAALLACQHDRGLKTILTPIVAKLSDMRIVNGELENMVFEPRKEFIIMQVLVVGNIPLLYFLNRDWFNTLMHTAMGQIILAVCAGVIFVSTAFVIKLTQPIEYRR